VKTLSDPSKTVSATVGGDFTLTLKSNATTGFEWRLAQNLDENVVRFVGKEYISSRSGLMGAGGVEVWTFQGVGNGRTIIHMEYVRPWEKGIPPIRNISFEVSVK
jgi:predicted secreted protein